MYKKKYMPESSNLDPDKARHAVGPDVGPNLLDYKGTTNANEMESSNKGRTTPVISKQMKWKQGASN